MLDYFACNHSILKYLGYILLLELGMINLKIKAIFETMIMKKLVLIMLLLPLSVFASDEINPNSYPDQCEHIKDSVEKKECFNIVKNEEAEQNFENFEENNQTDVYPGDF